MLRKENNNLIMILINYLKIYTHFYVLGGGPKRKEPDEATMVVISHLGDTPSFSGISGGCESSFNDVSGEDDKENAEITPKAKKCRPSSRDDITILQRQVLEQQLQVNNSMLNLAEKLNNLVDKVSNFLDDRQYVNLQNVQPNYYGYNPM